MSRGFPELRFEVTAAEPAALAAVPTLRFGVNIVRTGGGPVRSVSLATVIRIAAGMRRYSTEQKDRLRELFGAPQEWGKTMRPLSWGRVNTVVPAFSDSIAIWLPLECGYDMDLAATKYLHAVEEGEIPLEFLFSGTVFFLDDRGMLSTAQISWSAESAFSLGANLWHKVTNQEARRWIRVSKRCFDRLYRRRSQLSLPDWDTTLDTLLGPVDTGKMS